MFKWAKKMFEPEPEPEKPRTTMVEVLQELWDIDETKPHEPPPQNVNTDIYAVAPHDKVIPHRSSRRRRRYKKS